MFSFLIILLFVGFYRLIVFLSNVDQEAGQSSVRYGGVFHESAINSFCKLIRKLVGPNRRIAHENWRDALNVLGCLRGQVYKQRIGGILRVGAVHPILPVLQVPLLVLLVLL